MSERMLDVTDAELAVLQELWDHGPAPIRLLRDRLYPERTDASYATVQKLLERLEKKGHVRRDTSQHAHVFHSVTARDDIVGHRLRQMAEQLCGGMMGSLLTHLVRAEELSVEERKALRRLMDELDRQPDEREPAMTLLLQIGLANVAVASLLALLAFGVGQVCRKPALVHGLWLLVLLKLVTPPLFWLPIPVPTPEPAANEVCCLAEPEADPTVAWDFTPDQGWQPRVDRVVVQAEARLLTLPAAVCGPRPPLAAESSWTSEAMSWLTVLQPYLPILGWVWIAGAAAWFAWAGLHLVRFHRLLRFARPAPIELQTEADRLAERMGLARGPAVWLLPGALPPMVWSGLGQARLYFPAGLLERLDADERASLLAHELAHICRRDHWVRGLEIVVLGVYWWCPLVWWARRQLQAREEECCDAWVVGELPARSYASAILRTLDFLADGCPAVPLGASGLSARVVQLKRRLTEIMHRRTPKRLSSAGQVVVAAVGLVMLPLLPTVVLSQPEIKPLPALPAPETEDPMLYQVFFQPMEAFEMPVPSGMVDPPTTLLSQPERPTQVQVIGGGSRAEPPGVVIPARVRFVGRVVPHVVGVQPNSGILATFVVPQPDASSKTIRWLPAPGGASLPKQAIVVALKNRAGPPPPKEEKAGPLIETPDTP